MRCWVNSPRLRRWRGSSIRCHRAASPRASLSMTFTPYRTAFTSRVIDCDVTKRSGSATHQRSFLCSLASVRAPFVLYLPFCLTPLSCVSLRLQQCPNLGNCVAQLESTVPLLLQEMSSEDTPVDMVGGPNYSTLQQRIDRRRPSFLLPAVAPRSKKNKKKE